MSHTERHNDLVQFLEDHERLDELMKAPPLKLSAMPRTIIFEHVVMTRRENIAIEQVGTRIDDFVKLEGGLGLRIGRFVHIASFAHIGIGGGETIIEDFAAVASGGKVISGSNDVTAVSMSATAPAHMQRVQTGRTVLKQYSVVLTNAVVLPNVTLEEGAVLAAGGVAMKDIPAWQIWGGCPARFLAQRVIR